jgi:hypothetical protein
LTRSVPLPGAPTVGVRTREAPKPMSEFVHVFPNPDGDAKIIHEGLSWFGQIRPYVQRGREGIVFPCT